MLMNFEVINEIKKIANIDNHKYNYLAKQILINYHNLKDHNIIETAQVLNASPATIYRFVKEIGLKSFKNFNIILNYLDEVDYGIKNLILEDNDDVIQETEQLSVNAITNTSKLLNQQQDNFETLIFKILNAKQIFLFAVGGTYNIARDFQAKLNRLGINCISTNDYNDGYFLVRNLKNKDLALFISYSGKTPEVINLATQIKEINPKVIVASITEATTNPLKVISSSHLSIISSDSGNRYASTSSRISLLFVLDTIFNTIINIDKSYFLEKLNFTQIKK